ncbi:5-methyltetrahydropteroyltriglutamate--homocysteine S-methyltransferase, partial [bacterium]|nr:5-methyltetrahydropteroyltriglutamate--homocysteine S-methyltransferase [bacterium]
HTYGQLAQTGCALHVFTYYDDVDWMDELLKLPVQSIGLDFVHGTGNLAHILNRGFPKDKTLIAGLVDGRNIWRTNIAAAARTLKQLAAKAPRIAVSNAGPLYHLPITTAVEKFDPALLAHLAFAEERLHELRLIADAYDGKAVEAWWTPLDVGANMAVRERVKKLVDAEFTRAPSYPARRTAQRKALPLPVFPTTTIGSFPQSPELRKMRADYRAGRVTADAYKTFIRQKIADVIKLQEDLGLDVLVHGEFERTDMMEFFAQQLDGMATTSNGWIISYGTRVYRPAIVYGDVARPRPMSVAEISYAQSLTTRPVKGILTGPVTVLAWSFVREDVPIEDVACQLALCLRAELEDYERAGIKIVQVDEPAFRERAPVKRRGWPAYFAWAIKAFRLTCASMKPETQVHSHMCYSEFGEIIEHIAAMDFDAISIEASRSKGDILESFERIKFDRQIGLGVWDIHSPAVPTVDEMRGIVDRALKLIPRGNFWINPDCGLKTRGWDESIAALKNLVALAKALR